MEEEEEQDERQGNCFPFGKLASVTAFAGVTAAPSFGGDGDDAGEVGDSEVGDGVVGDGDDADESDEDGILEVMTIAPPCSPPWSLCCLFFCCSKRSSFVSKGIEATSAKTKYKSC